MNVIDTEKGFYEGVQDTILSGLMYSWFDKKVAQRIARCYGIPRYMILNYDGIEIGYYDNYKPKEIDEIFGKESDYPKDKE
jgi:hypothetical protein